MARRSSPLDGTTLLVVRASGASVVDAASGKALDHAGHRVQEHDRVLDARHGGAIITTDGGIARHCTLDATGALRDQLLGEDAARPGNPAPHGVLHALVTADGAVTYDTAHALSRFVK